MAFDLDKLVSKTESKNTFKKKRGRPTTKDQKMDQTISTYLTIEEKAQLVQKIGNSSIADYLRTLILRDINGIDIPDLGIER